MERASRLIGTLKLPKAAAGPEARARAAWRVAAGDKVAAHTRATGLVRDTLVVEVEDQIWQRQLTPLLPFLVRNLAAALGEPLVNAIDLRPMPARKRAAQAFERLPNEHRAVPKPEAIADPVLERIYRRSRKRSLAG